MCSGKNNPALIWIIVQVKTWDHLVRLKLDSSANYSDVYKPPKTNKNVFFCSIDKGEPSNHECLSRLFTVYISSSVMASCSVYSYQRRFPLQLHSDGTFHLQCYREKQRKKNCLQSGKALKFTASNLQNVGHIFGPVTDISAWHLGMWDVLI